MANDYAFGLPADPRNLVSDWKAIEGGATHAASPWDPNTKA